MRSTGRTSSARDTVSRWPRAKSHIRAATAAPCMSEDPNVAEQIADNVEQAAQWPHPSRLWLTLAVQRKNLSLAARRMLSQGGQLALKGVPDLSLDLMMRLRHAAPLAPGPWSCAP